MPGFRGGHGNAHGFRIPHLTHYKHIRRLAQRGTQRRGKIRRVSANFNLLNYAAYIRVLILNGIFNGQNVARIAAIDLIHQRGNCRRFSRARRAADQDQPARQVCQLLYRWRQVKFMEKWHHGGQSADRGCGASTLMVQIDAETAEICIAIRRVGDVRFQILPQGMRH